METIDKIYCISVETATERRQLFGSRMPELVNSPIFEWYIVKRDDENPQRGCYTSHQTLINNANLDGLSRIMIFEDDADLLIPWSEFTWKISQ